MCSVSALVDVPLGSRNMSPPSKLDGADSVRLRTLWALCGVELHTLAFIERTVTGRLDRAEVDEHIRSAAIYRDEAEALFTVEPLNGSLCHETSPSISRPHVTTLDCRRTLDRASAHAKLPGTQH